MKRPIIFFYIYCITFLIYSCKDKSKPIQPQIKNISESVYASGFIKSKNQYQVYSKVNGIVQKIFIKQGDLVKKGDALVQINSENARLNADNSRLSALNADYKANLDKLEDLKNAIALAAKKLNTDSLLLVRQNNLWKNKIGAKVELEQKELNFENSKTLLANTIFKYQDLQRQLYLLSAQSKNNLQISTILENDFLIKSEIDGKVYNIYKEENELVTNQSPVAVIGDASDFLAELSIDEKDIIKIKTGSQVLIRMDSYKNQEFEGIVSYIDPMMNERTRTFRADAEFVKKPDLLYPNLTVEANIVIQTKQNALIIPRNYLVNDSILMLEGGDLQKIKTGLMDYNFVEILTGISRDTKIILPQK